MDFDFGYGQTTSGDTTATDKTNDTDAQKTNLTTGGIDHDKNGVPAEDINDVNDGNNGNENKGEEKDKEVSFKDKDKEPSEDKDGGKQLQSGTTIELDGHTYTVDDSGNVVDENGNIYKEAKDVEDWLKEFDEVKDTDTNLSINSIQDVVGITITDDNDKPIEYENTPEGVKAYLNAVIELSKQEHYETAINTLYDKYPILNDVLNYYIANGNSLEGFNEMPDRSNITIDDTNEAQQEEIIKMAWNEQKRKGDVNSYIAYLKSSGILLATAKEELAALQEADAEYRKELEEEATRKEEQRVKELQDYWNGVHDVIKSRKIAGYQIPESIVINRNGQKISVTPEDFFNYLYRVDKDGLSAYNHDLAKQTPESRRDDEILRAYLTFVGGNYSNLVNMAINKDKVAALRLKAKEQNKTTLRITKPNNDKKSSANIDLGYN